MKKKKADLTDREIPRQSPTDEKTVKETEKRASRFRGSVRASIRKIWTDREYEDYRNRILNTPLP